MDKVSIVIPVYNQLRMTLSCLSDVLLTTYPNKEVILVNDGSQEPIAKVVDKLFPDVIVISNDANMGFARSCNAGIRKATGDLICLLNNDTRLPNSKWLSLMVDSMAQYDLTSPAGGRLDERFNYMPGEVKNSKDKFSYLAGWAELIKREVFDTIGLVPECFGKGFWEDVLFGYRAKKAGYRAGITEGTKIEHAYHTTFKAEGYDVTKLYQQNRQVFLDIARSEGLR